MRKTVGLSLLQAGARSEEAYHVSLSRRRSPVRIRSSPPEKKPQANWGFFFCRFAWAWLVTGEQRERRLLVRTGMSVQMLALINEVCASAAHAVDPIVVVIAGYCSMYLNDRE